MCLCLPVLFDPGERSHEIVNREVLPARQLQRAVVYDRVEQQPRHARLARPVDEDLHLAGHWLHYCNPNIKIKLIQEEIRTVVFELAFVRQ